MNDHRHKKALLTLAYTAAGILAAWLSVKYLLGWIAPFLLAGATAAVIRKPVDSAVKKLRLRRGAAAAIFTLFVTAAVLCLGGLFALEIYRRLSDIALRLPELLSLLGTFVQEQYDNLGSLIDRAPPQTAELLEGVINSALENASAIPGTLSGKLLDQAGKIASAVPKLFLFAAAYVIGTYFITASYDEIRDFILHQLPQSKQKNVPMIKESVFAAVGKWLRSEVTLMGITALELSAAFLLMGVQGPVGAAILVSIVDALPILGVGTVLIPWAAAELLQGQALRAIAVLVVYGVCTVVRSVLEPKVMGTHGGLHPVAALAAVYIGFSCTGIAGMLLFPIALMIIVQLQNNGVITIWKRPDSKAT